MRKLLAGLLLAGAATLSACATTDEYGYRDDNYDPQVQGAVEGAAIGAAAGAVGGAVIGGVSPIEGAAAGAVVGGIAGAIAADNDGDGYRDDEYYDRDRDGYYDGRYYDDGRPMPVKRMAPPPPQPTYYPRPSGERG